MLPSFHLAFESYQENINLQIFLVSLSFSKLKADFGHWQSRFFGISQAISLLHFYLC